MIPIWLPSSKQFIPFHRTPLSVQHLHRNSRTSKMSQTEFPCRLLQLPLEIRSQILRHLLVKHSVIEPGPTCRHHDDGLHTTVLVKTDSPRGHGLHTSILRACRQLHAEGHNMLYEANMFLVKIHGDNFLRKISVDSVLGRKIDVNHPDELAFLNHIKRFDIVVTATTFGFMGELEHTIEKVALQLACLPRLRQLHLTYRTYSKGPDHICLEHFLLLRNITKVRVSGDVPKSYRRFLETQIEGRIHLAHLPKMYRVLEEVSNSYIGWELRLEDDVRRAWKAVCNDDESLFMDVRRQIAQQIALVTEKHLNRLEDHDQTPSDGDWIVVWRRTDHSGKKRKYEGLLC